MSFYDDYEKNVRPELIKEGRLKAETSEEIDTNVDHSGAKPEPEQEQKSEQEQKQKPEQEQKQKPEQEQKQKPEQEQEGNE